ncbi:DNA polymerase V [Kosakonia cowanii]|uniref:DNA polymerase V n=1 Tax=Kosakonia cowanii TaxID=208223 RepID=UPI00289CCFFA|nr:DNA polymerase V [Kosakonia cowanii]
MPRRDDIETAFRQAIVMEQSGRRTVTTADFVKVLLTFNWYWTPREANQWIEGHVSTFKDISQQEGELRTFMMYNPNGGL